jgi:hypothetical protein
MKKSLLFTVSIIAFTINAKAQNPISFGSVKKQGGTQSATTSEKKPEFKFLAPEDTHDFGTIPEGPKAVYEFQFINTGSAPLIITNAQASCGCTSPEFSREPIMPGKKGKIKVTYATEGRVGNFTKSVYLTSNAQVTDGNGHYELKIKGIVLAAKK